MPLYLLYAICIFLNGNGQSEIVPFTIERILEMLHAIPGEESAELANDVAYLLEDSNDHSSEN